MEADWRRLPGGFSKAVRDFVIQYRRGRRSRRPMGILRRTEMRHHIQGAMEK